MIEALAVQMRIAWARAVGRRPRLADLEATVRLARADCERFGTPGGLQLVSVFTPAEVRVLQRRALVRTVRNAVTHVPYYREVWGPEAHRGLTLERFAEFPLTTKQEFRANLGRFFNHNCRRFALYQHTSGTTGAPLGLYISYNELESWPLTIAVNGLLTGEILPGDIQQVNLSSLAQPDWYVTERGAVLAGAVAVMQGTVPPQEAIASLMEERCVPGGRRRVNAVVAEVTYMVELARVARAMGLGRSDFEVEKVRLGGEPLIPRYQSFIEETFGARVAASWGASETIPTMGLRCARGNYHFDEMSGYLEVVHPDTGKPLEGDATGVLVLTPFYPGREGMPVLRYRTGDMVTRLRCGCGLPENIGAFRFLGREAFNYRQGASCFTQVDFLEALSQVEGVRLPVRYWAQAEGDATVVDVQVDEASAELERRLVQTLQGMGLDRVKVRQQTTPHFRHVPLRWEKRVPPEALEQPKGNARRGRAAPVGREAGADAGAHG
ncbi:MAG: hypothetical protein K6T75_07345 [Acetobacteraceae bacterium]|nr:hypothetical protein [Acetobacteraceae bacterium]